MDATDKTAKHTPGPWEVKPNYNSPRNAIMAGTQRIAVVGESSITNGDPVANAHLIAAAPELFEERKAIRDALGCLEWSTPQHAEEMLRELITKFYPSVAIAEADQHET